MVQARYLAQGIQKSHLKPLKINRFWVIVHICLNLGVGWPSLEKVCVTIGKSKFSFCVFHTVWTFCPPKMKSDSFSISSQFNFKSGHFFVLRCVTTIWSCCFHWRISKLKPIFLLNQKHQLLQFITIFIFHVAIVNLIHWQKIRSYL